MTKLHPLATCNTQIYSLSPGPHITHFSAVVAKKAKIFAEMFFKQANIACRQQMTTVNLLQNHFKQLSYYAASNWYFILIKLLSLTKSSII